MNEQVQQAIDQAIKDRATADKARGDVASQNDIIRNDTEELTRRQSVALDAHGAALQSAHAAIDALTSAIESDDVQA